MNILSLINFLSVTLAFSSLPDAGLQEREAYPAAPAEAPALEKQGKDMQAPVPSKAAEPEEIGGKDLTGTLGPEDNDDGMTNTFPVILEPYERSEIYAEVFSRVVALPKKMGDSFKKGDILIKFNDVIYQAAYIKAKSLADKALAELKVKKSLFQDHLITEVELKEAYAILASANYDLAVARKNLEDTEIRAPYSGRVAEVDIHLYELPIRDKPLMQIVNDHVLLANFIIPGNYLSRIHVGTKIYILIKETGEIIHIPIKRISPVINPASDTVRVQADIDNPNGRLESGMSSIAAFSKKAFAKQGESAGKILEEIKKEE